MDNFSFDTPDVEQGGGGSFIQQLPIILWQRKWWIIVPTVLGIIGAIAAIFLIPPVYRSNAIMLVESPQLPSEVIGSDDVDIVDRRIARIRQQVTARPDLIALIERHGLYASERKSKPLSEVIERVMNSEITHAPSVAAILKAIRVM